MFRRVPNGFMPMWNGMPSYYQRPMVPTQMQVPTAPTVTVDELPGTTTGMADFEIEPGPPVQDDVLYTQGFLRTQIGQYVKIEFLIGTNMLIDREGILTKVGISYIVLKESGTNDDLMCDIYSIKFVRIFDKPEEDAPYR